MGNKDNRGMKLMKKIVVLEGGFNEEHEVSLNTSKEVQKSLNRLRFEFEVILVNPKNFYKKVKLYNKDFLFFNALHGPYGEDGKIQKILEINELSFTHSDSLSSKIAFDKNLTKSKIKKSDIPFIKSILLEKSQIKIEKLHEVYSKFNSFVMKPVSSGSSFGVKFFYSIKDIETFFSNYQKEIKVYKNHNKIMIEKNIQGRELTVGVFENNNISESMEVTEIISKNSFYDYDAKYIKGLSKHIIPAKLPKNIYEKCLYYAKRVHDKLGCRGLSRSDFIYDEENIYFLEINSQPGLTLTSLVPEQLRYKNMNFDFLIKKIIEASL